MKPRKFFAVFSVIMLAALACNFTVGPGAGTIPTDTPTPGEVISGPPTDTPAPAADTATPTITLTPTSSIPTVQVSVDTNCRSGPRGDYTLLGGLLVGEIGEIVGQAPPGYDYVVIKNPDRDGECWLWLEYATITGDISGLQVYSIPPTSTPTFTPTATYTPTPTLPAAPSGLSVVAKNCTLHAHGGFPIVFHWHLNGVTLSWSDNANNETGYRVYRDGSLIDTLPANSTSFSEDPPGTEGGFTYAVEAYNTTGASAQDSVFVGNCP